MNISGQGEVYRTSYGADNLTAETSFSFGDQFNATTINRLEVAAQDPLIALQIQLPFTPGHIQVYVYTGHIYRAYSGIHMPWSKRILKLQLYCSCIAVVLKLR